MLKSAVFLLANGKSPTEPCRCCEPHMNVVARTYEQQALPLCCLPSPSVEAHKLSCNVIDSPVLYRTLFHSADEVELVPVEIPQSVLH